VFIAAYNDPSLNRHQLQNAAYRIFFPFQKVPVFHKVKIWNDDPLDRVDGKKALDVIHSCPARTARKGAKNGTKLPARFDTALISVNAIPGSGVTGKRYGMRCTDPPNPPGYIYRFSCWASSSGFQNPTKCK
jgi:hypothetical protein